MITSFTNFSRLLHRNTSFHRTQILANPTKGSPNHCLTERYANTDDEFFGSDVKFEFTFLSVQFVDLLQTQPTDADLQVQAVPVGAGACNWRHQF